MSHLPPDWAIGHLDADAGFPQGYDDGRTFTPLEGGSIERGSLAPEYHLDDLDAYSKAIDVSLNDLSKRLLESGQQLYVRVGQRSHRAHLAQRLAHRNW